jgi:putative NIF3 family GTP cyclohydrolase 1 type 2
MNLNEIREHLLSRSPWVDRGQTVDQILWGDGQRLIHGVGVGWMPSLDNLMAAHSLGCDAFVAHEPLFWEHRPEGTRYRNVEPGLAKIRFLDESGMVVLRAHDSWDNWPAIGIRDSWARGLGLLDRLDEDRTRWHASYRITETTLRAFAQTVANRISPLGEDSVRVYGDPARIVSRPALGVGCGGPDSDMVDLGADVLLVCDDGASYWATRERLVELGAAVIVVEHGTSEMWGIASLARYLAEMFPPLCVRYVDRHARPWTVTGDEGGHAPDRI